MNKFTEVAAAVSANKKIDVIYIQKRKQKNKKKETKIRKKKL